MTADQVDTVLAWVQVGGTLFTLTVAVVAILMWRRDQRSQIPQLHDELAHHLHDWMCDTGPWPHKDECWPAQDNAGETMEVLTQCAARGYGIVRPVLERPRLVTDDDCDGIGS